MNEEPNKKKQKIYAVELPKDCIYNIISFLNPRDFLKTARVSKDFYGEVKKQHPVYFSMMKLCRKVFLDKKKDDKDKTYHYIHIHSWIFAKNYLLDKDAIFIPKEIKNFINLKEEKVSLVGLDSMENYQNARSHFRFHIKPGTFIDFISSITYGMDEYAIAFCHSDDNDFDFSPYNLNPEFTNIIFYFQQAKNTEETEEESDIKISYALFNKKFIQKIKKDFFQSNKDDLDFYRSLTKSTEREIVKLKIIKARNQEDKLGYVKHFDKKRFKYFQKYFEKDYPFTLETLQILKDILQNSYAQYKNETIKPQGEIQIYNAKGKIIFNNCLNCDKKSQRFLEASFYLKFKEKTFYGEMLLFEGIYFGHDGYEGQAAFVMNKDFKKEDEWDESFGVSWDGNEEKIHWYDGKKDLESLGIDCEWNEFKREIFNQLGKLLPVYHLQTFRIMKVIHMEYFTGEINSQTLSQTLWMILNFNFKNSSFYLCNE